MLQVRIICHYTPTRNSQGGTNSLCNATHYEHFSCCYRYSNRPTANCDRTTITAESDMKQKRGKTFHTRTTFTNEDELSIAAVLKINCSKLDQSLTAPRVTASVKDMEMMEWSGNRGIHTTAHAKK